jgi:pimeloyl-ACP methyl ester carboxylesterase
MTWTQISLAGKLADIFDPAAKPRFGVLFLHGIGLETLAGNDAWTRILAERRLACICPHGQESWWLDRVCAEFDPVVSPERYILDHVVPLFRERWDIGPGALGVCGISMGGQGALRLALRQPRIFPAAAGIASALDFHEVYGQGSTLDDMFDSKERARQDTAIMHIRPDDYPPHLFFVIDPDDAPWLRGNDRLHEKLGALGIPHTIDLTTQAGGHSWTYFNRMAEPALRFLAEGLEKESRRLL